MLITQRRHQLALQAALLDGPPGAEAFASWCRIVPLDQCDPDEFRILPLIYLRARERDCQADVMGRLKGVYRQVWVRNTLRLQACAEALKLFSEDGIPSVLLKGIAMSARWAASVGPRAMRDLDILVHRADVRRASETLRRAGWISSSLPVIPESSESDLDWWHSSALVRSNEELDLHWRALPRNSSTEHDQMFWDGRQPVEVMGEKSHTLNAEDQLYHTLFHGARWTNGAGLDWVIDACVVLHAHQDILDWDRIRAHARRDQAHMWLRRQAATLDELLGLRLPIEKVAGRCSQAWLARTVERRYLGPLYYARRGEIDLPNYQDFLIERRENISLRSGFCFLRNQLSLGKNVHVLLYWLFRMIGSPYFARSALLNFQFLDLPLLARAPPIGCHSDPEESLRSAFLHGWSGPEVDGRWTEGREAILGFRDLSNQAKELPIGVCVTPYLTPKHRTLTVDVIANGIRCATWRFSYELCGAKSLQIVVPPRVRQRCPRHLLLAFALHKPASPARVGESNDFRRLGLFVRHICIGSTGSTNNGLEPELGAAEPFGDRQSRPAPRTHRAFSKLSLSCGALASRLSTFVNNGSGRTASIPITPEA